MIFLGKKVNLNCFVCNKQSYDCAICINCTKPHPLVFSYKRQIYSVSYIYKELVIYYSEQLYFLKNHGEYDINNEYVLNLVEKIQKLYVFL